MEKISNDVVQPLRVALVTGGISGIGAAIAKKFAEANYCVAISGRDEMKLEEVIQELKTKAPNESDYEDRFLGVQANFVDIKTIDHLMEKVILKFGRLDVLVNNTGHTGQALDLQHKDFFQDFHDVLNVNLLAATRLSQLASPYLVKSPRGVILNVSSVLATSPNPITSYCISKAGVSMLTEALANELEGTKVRVVSVAPGPINTTDMGRLSISTSFSRDASPEEVANVALFLESEHASFIHGTTIGVDGEYLARLAISAP